ncbi:GDT1-like protein 1, chloroplastic [Setaria italica]|uniref:GDT1-like protein 1, chloroplastic n=1 Tax=Setaria italica TaxID=4555 RepID=UPI0007199F8B|nr:GDT1-like protein 1, chloroplastic [Setaria italica]
MATAQFGGMQPADVLGDLGDISTGFSSVKRTAFLLIFFSELGDRTFFIAPPSLERPEHWIIYFDGALNLEGVGAWVLFISPKGKQLKYVLQIHYKATNNGAEYEALIHGLRIAAWLGIKRILAFGDSKVVIEQVNNS